MEENSPVAKDSDELDSQKTLSPPHVPVQPVELFETEDVKLEDSEASSTGIKQRIGYKLPSPGRQLGLSQFFKVPEATPSNRSSSFSSNRTTYN